MQDGSGELGALSFWEEFRRSVVFGSSLVAIDTSLEFGLPCIGDVMNVSRDGPLVGELFVEAGEDDFLDGELSPVGLRLDVGELCRSVSGLLGIELERDGDFSLAISAESISVDSVE